MTIVAAWPVGLDSITSVFDHLTLASFSNRESQPESFTIPLSAEQPGVLTMLNHRTRYGAREVYPALASFWRSLITTQANSSGCK